MKKDWFIDRLEKWIIALATMVEGFISAVTLGFLWPNWSFSLTFWSACRSLKRHKKAIKREI